MRDLGTFICACALKRHRLGSEPKDAVSKSASTMVGLVIEIVSGKLEECDPNTYPGETNNF